MKVFEIILCVDGNYRCYEITGNWNKGGVYSSPKEAYFSSLKILENEFGEYGKNFILLIPPSVFKNDFLE